MTTKSKRSHVIATCGVSLALVAAAAAAPTMSWATPMAPTVHPVVFAHHPDGTSKPDDITTLGGLFYVSYQNNAGKDGTPAGSYSNILAFDSTGRSVANYTIPGRVDGLTADPTHHQILATANEDLNSSLFVITQERRSPSTTPTARIPHRPAATEPTGAPMRSR